MRRHVLAAAALLLGFASQASALEYTLNDSFGSDPVSGDIVITIDDVAVDQVRVTVDMTALNSDEFIKELYLNTNTEVTVLTSGTASVDSFAWSPNAFKADGDGFHDLLVKFSADAADRMTGGTTYTFLLSGTGLSSSSFDDLGTLSVKGQFHAVAKINATGDGSGSDWVGDGNGSAVPEPGAALVFGVGMALVGYGVRRQDR